MMNSIVKIPISIEIRGHQSPMKEGAIRGVCVCVYIVLND